MESAKEKENKKLNDEILQLLSQPTAKVRILGGFHSTLAKYRYYVVSYN